MAFADYFGKNIQAASLILGGFDPTAFKGLLEQNTVGVAFDELGSSSFEGRATLDLIVRLLARLYPNIVLAPLDEIAKKQSPEYERLASDINPNISISKNMKDASCWLVLGATRLKIKDAEETPIIYIGSDNWLAKLSTAAPVSSGRSENPFGAGTAACLGAANIFRWIFSAQLPGSKLDTEINFSVLDLNPKAPKPKNLALKEVDLGEFHLVGAGAVGNGFLWGLSGFKCKGTLHLIDAERLESSNLQRYAMTLASDEGKFKVDLAKTWLSGSKLSAIPHIATWENYVATRNNWQIDCVAVAVDNAATRINVQAALPKCIFNSWTQFGEIGISRHSFIDDAACLACLYMPKATTLNFDQIVLKALRLPEDAAHLMEVRARLDTGLPTDRTFLERVSTAAKVPIDALLRFEGKVLRDFYVEAICGGAVLEFNSSGQPNRADVPMAFQSTLAGILLAADLVAETAEARPRLPTITQIDLLQPLPAITSTPRKKAQDNRCICGDLDFITQYKAKYPGAAKQARKSSSLEH